MTTVTHSLEEMRNLGPASAEWLASVGIRTAEDLEALGAVEAFCRVREAYPARVSRNLLWALQGALLDEDWRELPDEMRQELLAEAQAQPTRL